MLSLFHNLPPKEKRLTFATILTILRALIIPFVVLSMIFQNWDLAFLFFLIASITDLLDGIIARAAGEQTILGSVLDPIVDKILILSVYFTLSFIETPLFHIPKWFFIIVLAKELLLIFGTLYLIKVKGFFQLKPTFNGKLAMVFQVLFIVWLFSCYFFNWVPVKTYYLMLFLVLWFTIAVFLEYLHLAIKGKFK